MSFNPQTPDITTAIIDSITAPSEREIISREVNNIIDVLIKANSEIRSIDPEFEITGEVLHQLGKAEPQCNKFYRAISLALQHYPY